MNHLSLLALGTLLCATVATSLHAASPDTPKEYKDAEEMVVKLFKAYNKDDAKGVFENYIDAFKGMPDPLWNALFKPNKDKYGNYKKHTFVKEGSVATDDNILFVINVEFEKSKDIKVGVNLGKDGGKWKIQQVLFDVKP
jgi:ABC-type transporter MlaC component